MSDPELPDELQPDQDHFYLEVYGPWARALWVEEYHTTDAVYAPVAEGQRLWCFVMNLRGTEGPLGSPRQITVLVPLDAAKQIGEAMVRAASYDEKTLMTQGRAVCHPKPNG